MKKLEKLQDAGGMYSSKRTKVEVPEGVEGEVARVLHAVTLYEVLEVIPQTPCWLQTPAPKNCASAALPIAQAHCCRRIQISLSIPMLEQVYVFRLQRARMLRI